MCQTDRDLFCKCDTDLLHHNQLNTGLLNSFIDESCGKTDFMQRTHESLPEDWWNVIFETQKFSNNCIPSRDKTKDTLSTEVILSKKFSHAVAV
jgi:hypothetical protein